MRSNPILIAQTPDILFIKDGDGDVSITNDAEAVVAMCHGSFPGKRIVYCDTDDVWSELLHERYNFTGFAAYEGEIPS